LDELYVPLVDDPKTYGDYSKDLVPGALDKLVAKLRRTTWIFQGNPDTFDIMGYLNAGLPKITWSVTRYANEIAIGDRVLLWQAAGKKKAKSGIVAFANVVSEPFEGPDDEAGMKFWANPKDAQKAATRVLLKVEKVAKTKEIVQASWLREDPICNDLLILRQRAGTNYPVEPHHVDRLQALWGRTGVPWNRAESLAALRAYHRTYGGEISKKPNTDVAHLSLLIGRAVSSAYIKVVNFRAIDPRDDRKGMKGGGKTDRDVWAEFYDPATRTIREDRLEAEYRRLWADDTWVPIDADTYAEQVEREAAQHAERSLEELLADLEANPPKKRPKKAMTSSTVYERDARIVAAAKKRAGSRCEVLGCEVEPFMKPDGTPYVEVHHIDRLAEDGEDILDNVACVCPFHHREAHHGARKDAIKQMLSDVRQGAI